MITINLTKAKDIAKDNLRKERTPVLASLDVQFMRAVETGNTSLQTAIAEQKQELRDIILSCYEAEKVFVEESLPDGLQGLTKQDMVKYVQYVTDIVLNDFGCEVQFGVSNPLDYMARIGLSAKNNFFEKRDGEYTRVEIPSTIDGMFDEEF